MKYAKKDLPGLRIKWKTGLVNYTVKESSLNLYILISDNGPKYDGYSESYLLTKLNNGTIIEVSLSLPEVKELYQIC